MKREPVVNGQFYPDSAAEIAQIIERFKPEKISRSTARAIMLPHAGYTYSGKVAIQTTANILPRSRAIILGVNHTGRGAAFGLWPDGSWKIPGADIAIDQGLAKLIIEKGNTITADYLSHETEHSIEVELPILNYFFNNFSFVPITCAVSDLSDYRKAANQIYEAIRLLKEDVLLVASSDMTHYETDASARRKDRLALKDIVNLDEETLIKTVLKENISMCGIAPVAVMLACAKKIGVKKASVTLYQTSGDTSGDFSSVVGYAGVIIN